tara:strand:+ start:3292 stop:7326 length:4035 start_codon:yes stop_codon:yes gene_type:complete
MAKIQNNFLKGKMNKDLDERIVPKGEYREAQNVMITQSEGSDVGAVEIVLGNALAKGIPDFLFSASNSSQSRLEPLETIGYCSDVLNKKVYWFVSNFSGEDNDDIFEIKRAKSFHTCAILLADIGNEASTIKVLVKGSFLNFSKRHLITGVNLIDDLLFWTDNYNQPRKINVKTAFGDTQYYDNEEKISVAKFTPYLAPILIDSNNDGDGITLTEDSAISSEYLKENFVRFSYRYKYNDGEYSTMAPFTQVIFSPLNKARIENNPNNKFGFEKIEKETTVEIMQNFYNKAVIRIPLPCSETLATPLTSWTNDLKIKNIEILLKESDEIAIKVVNNIEVDSSFNVITESSFTQPGVEEYIVKPNPETQYYRYVYRYIYKSEEPYNVLPENQTTRVYDHVPLRAKAQEISGNRIIYGNYTENPKLPYDQSGKKGINYVINSISKADAEFGFDWGKKQHLHKAYKYHSLKQRRTYQVGVVLADKFGRQSSVILSTNETNDITDTHTQENISTPLDDALTNSNGSTSYSWSSIREAVGKSLNIRFNDNRIVPEEQVYNSDINSSEYNPYGWYSWRLVVKQNEQEYYNVYSTHPADSWNNINDSEDVSINGKSWLSLHGDNINKVPRIVSDVDANKEGVSSSEIRLFPKITKAANLDTQNTSVLGGNQDPIEVISIGSAREQGLVDEKGGIYGFVNSSKKNPSVAELPNLAPAGTTNGNRVLLHTNSIVEAIDDGNNVYKVTVTGNNSFIKVGHYVSSNNPQFKDAIIISADALGSSTGPVNKKTLRIKEADYGINNNEGNQGEEMIKVGNYVTSPGNDITTENSNGEIFRPTIVERERLSKTDGSLGTTILTLDKTITCPPNLVFREFTKVKSISSREVNGVIFQEIELDTAQNFSNGDILTFRNVDNSPVGIITGLSVFETEPFKSKLDIFYETSTSGLVSDLNLQASVVSELPSNLSIASNEFFEETNNNSDPLLLNADGTATNLFTYNIVNVTSSNEAFETVTNSFSISGTDSLALNGAGFVWNPENGGDNDFNKFIVSVNFSENAGGSATENLDLNLLNSKCEIQSNADNSEAAIDQFSAEGTVLFTCDVSNGSPNPEYESEHLVAHLSFPDRNVPLNNATDIFDQTQDPFAFVTSVIDTSYYPINWNGQLPLGGNFGMFKATINGTLLEVKTTEHFFSPQFFDGNMSTVNLPIGNDVEEVLGEQDRTIRVTISDGDTNPENWAFVDVLFKRGDIRKGVTLSPANDGCESDSPHNTSNNGLIAYIENGTGGDPFSGVNPELSSGNVAYQNQFGDEFFSQGTYKYLRNTNNDIQGDIDTYFYGLVSVDGSGIIEVLTPSCPSETY